MIRLSLGERLSLVFAALLLTSSGAAAWLQVRSNTLHEQELVQRLSSDLATHIAASSELVDENGLKPDALRVLFDQVMVVNPSVEVYLLDAGGRVVGHAAPPGHVKRDTIDVVPIERLLAGEPLPILGDDPRSESGRKVFSAARLQRDGLESGYVYVILMGETRDLLAADGAGSRVLRTTLWSMAIVALLALVAGLIAFRGITRPLRALTMSLHALDMNNLAGVEQVPRDAPAAPGQRDEIAILRNAVGRMAARIAEQWRELTRKDEERRELVANVSHDLRTPLTSLHGYLETLATKSASLSDDERRRYLMIALAQSDKVGKLARELFELARLEHEALKPEKEAFSLVDLVQDVVQKLELLAGAKRQRIVADIPGDIPNVTAALPMIERVLTNLLDNAIRHTPEGTKIRIELRCVGTSVEVLVADDGPGIPAELRASLFQRPSVLSGARAGQNGGLGLLIVRRILDLHQTRIELVDTGKGGAAFRFLLDAVSSR
jgi:signal transduction histidine kinase